MQRTHHTIDATDKAIGRIATEAAVYLMGKHKPTYRAHIDEGDFVRVVNYSKIKMTGKKLDQKELIHHSWHPGGIKRVPLKRVMEKNPNKALIHAVSKMLPRNTFRTPRTLRLTIVA